MTEFINLTVSVTSEYFTLKEFKSRFNLRNAVIIQL
jgi:hypothetical protein